MLHASPHTQMVPRLTNESEHHRLIGLAHSRIIQTMLSALTLHIFTSKPNKDFCAPNIDYLLCSNDNNLYFCNCATLYQNHCTCASFLKIRLFEKSIHGPLVINLLAIIYTCLVSFHLICFVAVHPSRSEKVLAKMR